MKHQLSVVCAFFCLVAYNAAADPQTERIRQAAKENSTAFTTANYDRLVDLTYPKVVELLGGREKMIELLRRGAEDMKSHGSSILGADIAEPKEVITAGDKRFAIVPKLEMFNTFNNTNNVNPLSSPQLFDFNGFLRVGVGDPRQAQLSVRIEF